MYSFLPEMGWTTFWANFSQTRLVTLEVTHLGLFLLDADCDLCRLRP
jgi:hypothetical protein